MLKKTFLTFSLAALAFSPAAAVAQSTGSGPSQTSCQPMILDALAQLNRVPDEHARGQIMDTLDQARLELRQRDYDACVNLAQLALNQIDRNAAEVPFGGRPGSTFEQPAVPAPLNPGRAPGY
ncbi:MAG: hypothetical protein HYZ11_10005 [Candidatus Tectomicrobia bacterium]|uniref:Uncharacterized protein n=1 Tax=Tectimicrobiota bacterium TaxID=2528274 RepID=A0A932I222_UNCTE|nr:hypothetical protein [Candidatus Tectomicrobia bacterium]